jgi:hypothetical protein
MSKSTGAWNPTKYKVECCGDVIWSRFPGEFRKCACGFSAVDQTEYYARFNGHFKGFTKYKEPEEEDGENNQA